MLNDWDHRLAKTPQNRPAHLLDALTVDAAGAVRQKEPISNVAAERAVPT